MISSGCRFDLFFHFSIENKYHPDVGTNTISVPSQHLLGVGMRYLSNTIPMSGPTRSLSRPDILWVSMRHHRTIRDINLVTKLNVFTSNVFKLSLENMIEYGATLDGTTSTNNTEHISGIIIPVSVLLVVSTYTSNISGIVIQEMCSVLFVGVVPSIVAPSFIVFSSHN